MGRKVKPHEQKEDHIAVKAHVQNDDIDGNLPEIDGVSKCAWQSPHRKGKQQQQHQQQHPARSYECASCEIKSQQIAKVLKILSQTLRFLEEAKKRWKRDFDTEGNRKNEDVEATGNGKVLASSFSSSASLAFTGKIPSGKQWKMETELATLEQNIANFLFTFSEDVSVAALGEQNDKRKQKR